MGSKYKQSPIGEARHAWVNKPDTKYNADGLYHVKLVLGGDEAAAFKSEVDALVEAAYLDEAAKSELKPADLKKWGKYYPYEVEEDDQGAPTGYVVFNFKQNAKIKLKDGGTKVFKIGIRDGKNKPTEDNVFGGSTIRVLWAPRNVKLATAKQFGVRLDFSMVQLIKKAPLTGGGFDEVDEAYAEGAAEERVGPEAEY